MTVVVFMTHSFIIAGMAKRPFKRKIKRKVGGATFWDKEYAEGGHLKLSDDAAEDFKKFTRWLERQSGKQLLNPTQSALDLGCGNGRNLHYLHDTYGMHGVGYDVSAAAIKQAKLGVDNDDLSFVVRSIAGDIACTDDSQALVLDMMSSHFLTEAERTHLRDEIYRVLKPGGWLFMKTFLRDGDLHSERLLKEFPGKEDGTYIHPVMNMPEHVYYEEELISFLEELFVVHKTYRSHKHVSHGKARKRRTISVYAEKSPF